MSARSRRTTTQRVSEENVIRVLRWFAEHPGATVREASAGLGVSSALVGFAIRELRLRGFVEPNEGERNRKTALTLAGWRALALEPRCAACGQVLR